MTDLTEQWKKGELEWDREYYVDLENNGIVKQLYLDEDGDFFDGIIDYSLKNKPYIEVLAPVPSFKEWMRTKYSLDDYKRLSDMRGKIIDKMEDSNEDSVKYLRKENQQLKELLREWVQFETEENPNDFTVISERMSELANKTKQAIGEKR